LIIEDRIKNKREKKQAAKREKNPKCHYKREKEKYKIE